MHKNERDLKEMLDRYLSGKATPEEQVILDKFFQDNKDEALRDELNAAEYKFHEYRIKSRIDERLFPVRKRSVAWRVAASLTAIAIAAFAYLMTRQPNATPEPRAIAMLTRTTERGQKITIKLPDGTLVKLNSRSKLVFPEAFTAERREVVLEGEGYFDVIHNPSSPFIVRTGNASTQVLGTSFNVSHRDEAATTVTLVSGKVNVNGDQQKGSGMQLKPNQQAVIRSTAIDTASVDVSQFIEWKDNVLSFDNTPLKDVVKELEDWYGVDISVRSKAIENCRITARYEAESLENVLESFEFMLKGEYTLQGKTVTLTGKGCRNK